MNHKNATGRDGSIIFGVAVVVFLMVDILRAVEVAAMVMLVGLSGQAIPITHRRKSNNRRNNHRNHRVHGSTAGRKPI